MIKRLLLAFVLLYAICANAGAIQIGENEYDTYYDAMKDKEEKYNGFIEGQSIPSVLNIFLSERINLQIDNEIVGIELNKGKIVDLQNGGLENPAVKFTTTDSFMQKVINSDNPINEVVKGLESGELKRENFGVVSKIKGVIFSISLKLFSSLLK